MAKRRVEAPRPAGAEPPERQYEAEAIFGLEEQVAEELRALLGGAGKVTGRPARGRVAFRYGGPERRLGTLRTAVAVHRVETFAVPRPRALLGHEHLTRLLGAVDDVLAHQPRGALQTFRLSAAGADSPVFTRIKEAVAAHTGLRPSDEGADLLLAARPAPGAGGGWQVLVRLTARPLSARAWRVCNMPGALNATVAHVMARLASAGPGERVLNIGCGSGTLLVERLALRPAALALGVDTNPAALDCARQNLAAAGQGGAVTLLRADATRLPLPAGAMDLLLADLPYGMLVGSGDENRRLYPALLAEAARVTAPGGAFGAITASRRLFEESVAQSGAPWALAQVLPIELPWERGYLRASIYLLRRQGP